MAVENTDELPTKSLPSRTHYVGQTDIKKSSRAG